MKFLKPREFTDEQTDKKVFWLVLTGGPCSGKTTALARLEQELTNKGYKVFVIDEAATQIINWGIKHDEYDVDDFQSYIAYLQIAKEAIVEEAVKKCKYDNIIVICDRGLIDGKAYMPDDEREAFKKLVNSFETTEVQARESYDAVIHLLTAANGAEKYYTLATNKARFETPEKAREVDDRTVNAWVGHSRFRMIDNSTNFSKKINRVMDEVYSLLGVPIPIEVYKKYLISMPDLARLEHESNFCKIEITRTYLLNKDNSSECSILQRGGFGDYAFYYTEKRHFKGFDRIDVERRLTRNEYVSLIGQADARFKQLAKTRYCFVWNSKYYELDVFDFWQDKAMLKIQLTNRNASIEIPEFLNVLSDITDNSTYTNYSLAQNIYN